MACPGALAQEKLTFCFLTFFTKYEIHWKCVFYQENADLPVQSVYLVLVLRLSGDQLTTAHNLVRFSKVKRGIFGLEQFQVWDG